MFYSLTWGSCTHSPATVMIPYSMANSKHKHGECREREQSHTGILIRPFRILFHFIYRTW